MPGGHTDRFCLRHHQLTIRSPSRKSSTREAEAGGSRGTRSPLGLPSEHLCQNQRAAAGRSVSAVGFPPPIPSAARQLRAQGAVGRMKGCRPHLSAKQDLRRCPAACTASSGAEGTAQLPARGAECTQVGTPGRWPPSASPWVSPRSPGSPQEGRGLPCLGGWGSPLGAWSLRWAGRAYRAASSAEGVVTGPSGGRGGDRPGACPPRRGVT